MVTTPATLRDLLQPEPLILVSALASMGSLGLLVVGFFTVPAATAVLAVSAAVVVAVTARLDVE